MPGAIELTEEEGKLVADMTFEASEVSEHTVWRANGDKVVALWKLLSDRDAIPPHRLQYFTDPAYFVGGHGKSHEQIFAAKGRSGEDLLRHAHFLEYLRYMIFGPILPASAIAQVTEFVRSCGNVTSGDIIPIADEAKRVARAHHLTKTSQEAFYQLVLDLGLGPSEARYVWDAIGKLK